jgi:hypothetical protein
MTSRAFLLAIFAMLAAPIAQAIAPSRTLDDFSDASRWTASSSDQVTATLRKADDGLCLAYDFHGVSGYASMRRPLALDFPVDYEFDVRVRGQAPKNALQFKLTDANNENVWWVNRGAFEPPREWAPLRFKKREISFAWGPRTDHDLRHSDAVELTIYADKGGSGEICFADLEFHERTPSPATPPRVIATASSSSTGHAASNAVDADAATSWRSARSSGVSDAMLTLDLGYEREFGGLVVHWHPPNGARRYEIALSDDGNHWRTVRTVTAGRGSVDPLYLPDSEARFVRLSMHGARDYAIDDVDVKDLAFGASANAFFSALAKAAPRGFYPRGFYDEQTYWTIVGVDGGHETGLLSEDGALEVAKGGFSIAPFLVGDDGAVTGWADVSIAHSLAERYLPIPTAMWQANGVTLSTTAFADGDPGASRLVAAYDVENTGDAARTLTLALVVQPFQVNPAVQFLNTPGGVSPIATLAMRSKSVDVDGVPRVFPLASPDRAFATPFDSGMAPEHLAEVVKGQKAQPSSVDDPTKLASGALLYRMTLPARAKRTIGLVVPLEGAAIPPRLDSTAEAWIAAATQRAAVRWHEALDRVDVFVPPAAQPIVDTMRTALADILISRDGPALRPGTRAYARSWIRDGAMMSTALLRLGRADVARAYLDWSAPYQFASGKVPCCVDARGSDPVPENDSHGELIVLADEVRRYANDRAAVEAAYPHVRAAIAYMDSLRASESQAAKQDATREAFSGLMPASISHEGYSAKPMHSYWDDFWALAGYASAVDIATALGKTDDAARFAKSRDALRSDIHASIARSVAGHGIDYIPGSAELGDFDATSTTIALSPAGQQFDLPRDLLHNTFERYWNNFVARRDGTIAWNDYTPYEWRTVGTFVRLGWRERAQQAIDFFMRDRRPPGWNQWAEVVGRDPRESRFVGDMPHGWVASDFIRSTLDLFAYERESDHAMVLAAGIPAAWLDDGGISIGNLRTPYGALSYSLKRDGDVVRFDITGDRAAVPPGGFVLEPPIDAKATVSINGKHVAWSGGALRIGKVPAHAEFSTR